MQETEPTMTGKVCVVTGGNSGIGLETVRALAAKDATVALVSRDREKGEAAARPIRKQYSTARVDVLTADFASLATVRQLAEDILARYARLDVLVNNAGVMVERRTLTPDGYEVNFQVNYLAPFLLTNLLLDRLKASAPARIVNVSSAAHMSGRLRWEDYEGGWRVGGWRSYGDSKLALVMFTREMARRLEGTGVTVNALHPGVIASGFGQEQGNISGLFFKYFKPFLSTTEQGAQTQIYLATSPEVEGVSGEYFTGKRARRASPRAYDDTASRRLWDLSSRLVGLETPASDASTATA